ncbi:monosaccharide ABC transporter substrate-binding protein (CUT2 family) [Kribbella pratensis]|jgi:fructose transport system substrate-binding protein|uniref:Monosaccharide ABC transporter substrate-binding protein (CUT2 family) n=1 Tax=Kribbella pratensis TaxID=2512112 RepID=A0ABY2FMK7_9ACTN|nr:substrate-binding domain-containing protein [Kribbella pratensis]TDW94348.1 monosaccharide ABC transporter substrate-binding protein (CUT2 family) [Kribbella pratensis]
MKSTGIRRSTAALSALACVGALVLSACTTTKKSGPGSDAGDSSGPVKVGLVTKTETNPYFVKLRESAKAAAEAKGGSLIALAGKFDGDNEGQVTAIENLVQQGVKGILITPSNSAGVLGAIKQAQDKGVVVIALDTQTEPADAVAATYATNNENAGKLIGQYVKARLGDTKPQLVMMDLDPSASVGKQRHNGFLEGMGLPLNTPDIIGSALTQGDQTKAQQAMENLLQRVGGQVNAVYNINEPAARGAYQALKEKGLTDKVLVGAIDGGCQGVQNVKDGLFVGTVMQFPKKMAEDGVNAVFDYAQSGKKPSGFIDTGATLITDKPVPGLESKDTAWGAQNCWG